jgi:M6 family metalloprotease-like protein
MCRFLRVAAFCAFVGLCLPARGGDDLRPARTADPIPDFAGTIGSPKLRPAAGIRKVIVILWNPHRARHPAPPAKEVERLLFGERPSVRDWFRENSGGRFGIESVGVFGWYDADKPAEHYWSTSARKDALDKNGDGWLNGHVEKWTEAILKADRKVDFASFDSNGDKILSPDELGILIVIPQQQPFGTNRQPVAREFPHPQPLVVDGVRVPVIAEWYTGAPPNLGGPAHELCHLFLGLPDLYIGQGWPYSAGDYSLMDHSYTSAHLDPFQKLKLGWLKYRVVTETKELELRDVETSGDALILFSPEHGPKEYFLIENRCRGKSYDAGADRAGRGLAGQGLAVWQILEDPKSFAKSTPPIGGPGEWGRRGIRLIRANGGVSPDDRNALFDRRKMVLSDDSTPAKLRWLDGSRTGFSLEMLSDAGPTLRLRIGREPVPHERPASQAVNLLRTAAYTSSSDWDRAAFAASKAFDGKTSTRWNSRAGNARGAWLAARWNKPVTVSQVVVRQAFDRMTGLKLQMPDVKGDGWTDLVVLEKRQLAALNAGTPGNGPNDASANPVFVISLPKPVEAVGLRLLVTSVVPMERGSVSVSEFEAYAEPRANVGK